MKNQEIQYEYRQPQGFFQRIYFSVVRPPRQTYNRFAFQSLFSVIDHGFREVIHLEVQHQNIVLPLSVALQRMTHEPLVLFCHGNSSSRYGSLNLFSQLPKKYSFGCFDFGGCGMSTNLATTRQDQIISVGVQQSKQLNTVIKFIRQRFKRQVIPWGTSMGAVSVLLAQPVPLAILDSPFSDFKELASQLVDRHKPQWLSRCCSHFLGCIMIGVMQLIIRIRAGFSLGQLNILNKIQERPSQTQLIFLAGHEDALVDHHHSYDLFRKFRGTKDLIFFKGKHNDRRPGEVLHRVFQLIDNSDILQEYKLQECNQTERDLID